MNPKLDASDSEKSAYVLNIIKPVKYSKNIMKKKMKLFFYMTY